MTATNLPPERPSATGWLGLVALAVVAGATVALASHHSALTRTTIHLALAEYVLALWLMTGLSSADWRAASRQGRFVRWLWTWACLTFLVHVACAFQFTHRWSHAQAFEQTRLESGFGEGLYVNYLFMLLWSADVAWWWIAAEKYAYRSVWIDRTLHGFLLFIAFNATVVFEHGVIRSVGAVVTLLLAARWLHGRRTTGVGDSALNGSGRSSA